MPMVTLNRTLGARALHAFLQWEGTLTWPGLIYGPSILIGSWASVSWQMASSESSLSDVEEAAAASLYLPPPKGGYQNGLAALIFLLNAAAFLLLLFYCALTTTVGRRSTAVIRESCITIFFSVVFTILIHFLIQKRPTLLMHSVCCLLILFFMCFAVLNGYFYNFPHSFGCILLSVGLMLWYHQNARYVKLTAKLMFYAQGVAYRYNELVYFAIGVALLGWFLVSVAQYSREYGKLLHDSWSVRLLFHLYWQFSIHWCAQFLLSITRTVIYGIFILNYRGTVGRNRAPVTKIISHCLRTSIGKIAYGCILTWPVTIFRTCIHTPWAQSLGRYYNYYAFGRVVFCDESYQESARIAWEDHQVSCVRRVARDQCVGAFILLCSSLVGILSTLILLYSQSEATTLLEALQSRMGDFHSLAAVGMAIPQLYFKTIDAGSTATLVAITEDANLLEKRHPKLYRIISSDYLDNFTV